MAESHKAVQVLVSTEHVPHSVSYLTRQK